MRSHSDGSPSPNFRWVSWISVGLLALSSIAVGTATAAESDLPTESKPAAESKPPNELKAAKRPIAATNFHLRDLNGKPVRLSDFQGQVVLLNFWATWCPPCLKEMPSMEQLYQSYKDKSLEIIAVSVDTASSEDVRAFAEKLGLTFRVLHDRDSLVSRLYSNPGVPSSYVIDAQGKVAYRVLGEYDWFGEKAKTAVEALLTDVKRTAQQ